MILICGGDVDPNIHCLIARARKSGLKYFSLLVGAKNHPNVSWDFQTNTFRLNNRVIRPTAAFIRHDVFTNLADGRPASAHRAYAWYSTAAGWVEAHPEIRYFNRHYSGSLQKPAILSLARSVGLKIPYTLVTNDLQSLKRESQQQSLVVKPVMGGDFCQELSPVLRNAPRRGRSLAAPAIVQECLVTPDLRIYIVGKQSFSFQIRSSVLDYRTTNDIEVKWLRTTPRELSAPLRRLARLVQMNFLAADFKACPESGVMKFLEINSSPMFAAFDVASKGQLSSSMLAYLNS